MPSEPSLWQTFQKSIVSFSAGSAVYLASHPFMVSRAWMDFDVRSALTLDPSAVKCNPDPYILRLLAALGSGFDCASHGEIAQVMQLGTVAPSRVLFANPCKAVSFIRHASKFGVDAMTFDNADELLKISHAYPDARLVLRILTDDSKSLCRLGLKFGAPLHTVPQLLSRAKELKLNVVGVSFHVGSGCYDPRAFADAIALAREAFDIGRSVGYGFTLLDVGGGFEDDGFENTAALLRTAILKHFSELLKEGLEVIAEPGRFFVSKAFTLATNIIARRAGIAENGLDLAAVKAAEQDQPQVMCKCDHLFATAFLLLSRVLTFLWLRLHQRWRIRGFQLYFIRPPGGKTVHPHIMPHNSGSETGW